MHAYGIADKRASALAFIAYGKQAAMLDPADITELQPKAAHILMTILLHLGYLITPEQRRMITNVQRSTSGEFDVIASISTQPKQRSENRRVLSPAMSMGPL
jgi:hypothetical protein